MVPAPGLPRPADVMPLVSGPYVTLGVVAALALLARMVPSLPDPSVFLLMAVVYAGYSGGVPAGVVSTGIVLAYAAAHFGLGVPGRPPAPGDMESFLALALAAPATVGMVGWLQRRSRHMFEVEAANARLRHVDELKTQFLGTAAEELRTPLEPMRTQLSELKARSTGRLDAPQRQSLAELERNVARIESVAGDLLEVARFQAGFTPLERTRVDLAELVREAAWSWRDPAHDAGLALEVETPPKGAVEVEADPRRVLQVMFNLLGNAINFTPKGGRVRVEARVAGGMGLVRVEDTGQGISPEALQRLFHPFAQVHEQGAEPSGTGLGLFISKGLVELHGGQIWAESQGPGKGSAFTFTLPLAGGEVREADAAGVRR